MSNLNRFHALAVVTCTLAVSGCGLENVRGPQRQAEFTDSTTTKILVAYYSRSGSTKQLAAAVADGAASVSNTEVVLKSVTEVETEDLVSADGVIVGSPVFYGNMAYQVKQFFDNWAFEYDVYSSRRMAFKAGGAFATGFWASGGKEMVINSINAAFLNAAMVVVGGEKGAGASATGEDKGEGRGGEMARSEYRDGYVLGQRVAQVAAALKHGLSGINTPEPSGPD